MASCNICEGDFDEYDIQQDEMPFCANCASKWKAAYALCGHFAQTLTDSNDQLFDLNADTYSREAMDEVSACLSQVVSRNPVTEEALDSLRRKQYKRLQKFDPSKVDQSL